MAWIRLLQAISLKKSFAAVQQKTNDSLADMLERENVLFPDVEIQFWQEAPAHNYTFFPQIMHFTFSNLTNLTVAD